MTHPRDLADQNFYRPQEKPSTFGNVRIPDVRAFELLNEVAKHFSRARRDRSNRGADVVEAVDAVEQIVFKRHLLDLFEVVLERRFSQKLVNVLKRRGWIPRQPVEVDEVHSIAEAARERVLDANV